jgi:selenide,water dikinase
VYRWEAGPALVQTVDFFTPIVDDPFTYGQIAAANALSDVYAMGGRPLTALAIAGFPEDLDPDTIRQIFLGGHGKLREAGVALLGGHTVKDREVKFGYAVTGAIDPDRVLTNAGARAGDMLVLTKPLGTGIIGTAIKLGHAPEISVSQSIASMITLNRAAAEVLAGFPLDVHSCTDVTGFGLVGHSTEMASGSGVTLVIAAPSLPIFPGALELAASSRSGGLTSNRAHFGPAVQAEGIAPDVLDVCYDPQTSGGLLAAIDPARVGEVVSRLGAAHVPATVVGRVIPATAHRVAIVMR